VTQVMSYRWLALLANQPPHLGLHAHPGARGECEAEVRQALNFSETAVILGIEDEDASAESPSTQPLVRPIEFGQEIIARIALSQKGAGDLQDARILMSLLASWAVPCAWLCWSRKPSGPRPRIR